MLYHIDQKSVCYHILSSGMLLRYFVNFYDMEIIEEEAFLAWKEDITQEFPGKGKALFQVLLLPCRDVAWQYVKNICQSLIHIILRVWPSSGQPVAHLAGDGGGRGVGRWSRLRKNQLPTTLLIILLITVTFLY